MNNEYRLLPVALAPHIKDAIVASGHFMPESLWAAIIAAHDLVVPAVPENKLTECRHCGFFVALNRPPADAAPERSETLAGEVTVYVFDAPDCEPVIEACTLSPGRHTLSSCLAPAASSSAAPSDEGAEEMMRRICKHFGWRTDGKAALLADRIRHHVKTMKGCIKAHEAVLAERDAALADLAAPSDWPTYDEVAPLIKAKLGYAPGMPKEPCECVYATAENTPSVRNGYEIGGYVKEECQVCKGQKSKPAAPAASPAVLTDAVRYQFLRTRDVSFEGEDGNVFVSFIPELGHDGSKLDACVDEAIDAILATKGKA